MSIYCCREILYKVKYIYPSIRPSSEAIKTVTASPNRCDSHWQQCVGTPTKGEWVSAAINYASPPLISQGDMLPCLGHFLRDQD